MNDRESKMITLRTDESGKPTVWCDPEIADLVDALNTDKLSTVASCSGHGHRPGRISLKDGRELLVMDSEQVATVERLFDANINGASQESAPGQEAVALKAIPFAKICGTDSLPDSFGRRHREYYMQELDYPAMWPQEGAVLFTLGDIRQGIADKVPPSMTVYLAPPTSTAIAAVVIKQAADIVVDRAHTPYAKNWDEVAETIRNLLPANAEEELVKVILKVINEAQEYTEEGVRRVLDEKGE
jgi:hypothetical protein